MRCDSDNRGFLWLVKRLSVGGIVWFCCSAFGSCEETGELARLSEPFDFDGPAYMEPQVEFEGTWPEVPEKMMVYRVVEPNISEGKAREIAEKLIGLRKTEALKRTSRLGMYWMRANGRDFELDPQIGHIIATMAADASAFAEATDELPDANACEIAATGYLRDANLLPTDTYIRAISERKRESGYSKRVSFGRIIGKYKAIGRGASIDVEIGKGGQVVRVRKLWQELVAFKEYPIRSPQEALQALNKCEGYLIHGQKGKAKNIALRYYTSPQRQEYVQPVYRFECEGKEGRFFGEVPAVRREYLKPIGDESTQKQ